MIEFQELSFSYLFHDGYSKPVFEGLTFSIPQGAYVALMGPNGSGKSTLGKLVKGLLSPSSGQVLIHGLPLQRGEICSRVGYIFSNPENQIISSVVEEDVAFGLGNMGIEPSLLSLRVEESLRVVGMEDYRAHSPHLLSGGQQQKVVIAGILAMDCEILVLDEPTSMLDPRDRREILDLLKKIQGKGPKTLLHITHSFEEALSAQDLMYLDRGRVGFYGSPEEFLISNQLPEAYQFQIPPIFDLIQGLRRRGNHIPIEVRSYEQLRDFLFKLDTRPGK